MLTALTRRTLAAAVAAAAAVLVSVTPTVHATTPTPPPVGQRPSCTGRCVEVAMPTPKRVHVTSNLVRILLPAHYRQKKNHTRYPVVYMLCGAGGGQTEWLARSDITSFTASMKDIFVFPDCGEGVHPGWYSNWSDGEWQWETYYINIVIPWINKHLRTIKGDAAIAGLSMGGYGALSLAERHPSLFKAVGSFSGIADTQVGPATKGSGMYPAGLWGDQQTNAANWRSHNPTAMAAKLKGKDLFIACGTGAPTSSTNPTYVSQNYVAQFQESFLFQTHVPFLAALEQDKIPFHSNFWAGGEHTWTYFQYAAHWALPQIVAALQR